MDTKKGLPRLGKIFIVLFLLTVASGCSIGRVYVGSEFKYDPATKVIPGQTTKSQILEAFGAPDLIQRQHDGDVFIYAYIRRNYSKLSIQEPIITNLLLFSYSNIQEKKDNLVILFDREGAVKSFGFQRRTDELTPY